MEAFLFMVAVSFVVNIITALSNREIWLRLLPWFLLLIFLHGSYVAFGEATYVAAGLITLLAWKFIVYQVNRIGQLTATSDVLATAVVAVNSPPLTEDQENEQVKQARQEMDALRKQVAEYQQNKDKFSVVMGRINWKCRRYDSEELFEIVGVENLSSAYNFLVLIVEIKVESGSEREVGVGLVVDNARHPIPDRTHLQWVHTGKYKVAFDVDATVSPTLHQVAVVVSPVGGEPQNLRFSLTVPDKFNRD